jgi:endonuclease/exonuclease/phosphatase family metal-dependent hydrolase
MGPAMGFRIATYNIHRCIGRDGINDPQRIAGVLAAMDADLVALQEVAFDPGSPGDVLQFLAEAAGARAIAGPTLLEPKGRYGNAILSRIAPREVQRADISVAGREPRGALQLVLETSGMTVSVLATHLGLSMEERRRQMARIVRLLEQSAADVTVLLGDFNEWRPWGFSLRPLKRRFGHPATRPTFPSRRPFLALDRIWVHPFHRLKSLRVFKGTQARAASDHLPLVADIEL